ncbi:MAG TPA: serine hydrolase [Acholeplasmataceae bacterium]|nr:serine hydrolase [Acholeplasmataceae bacterium]
MITGLNKLIEKAIAENTFPGANYSLIANGKKYFESFGNKALIPEVEKNDINTLYDMASLTKVIVTTTAVMILLEQGKIRLSDSVKLYVPKFRHSQITIWDLMTHTSGLPSDVPGSLYRQDGGLEKYLLAPEVIYPKNTKILYSDMGYLLLGFVIESVSGMKLNEFAEKYIFEPLEMKDSGYNPKDTNRCASTEVYGEVITRGYVHDEKAYALDGVAGHAGLFSTVTDVSNFMEMILNDGVYKGKQILSKKSIDLLFTPQVEEYTGISLVPYRRGLGWIIQGANSVAGDYASKNTIMHTGFTGTHMYIDRDNKIAFCLLSNRVHPTRDNNLIIPFRARLGNYILNHF